jgi:hypothetical protein
MPAVVEVNKIEEGLGKPPAPTAHLLLIGIAIGGRDCRGWDHLALQRRRRFAFWGWYGDQRLMRSNTSFFWQSMPVRHKQH